MKVGFINFDFGDDGIWGEGEEDRKVIEVEVDINECVRKVSNILEVV